MRLFKYEGYRVAVSEEALAIKAFRDVWEADASESKETAALELAYVYFMCDPRSDYMTVTDEGERSALVARQEGLPAGWRPSRLVKAAMGVYRGFKPASALLLDDIRASVDKLRAALRSMDLDERDASGRPVYKAADYAATLERLLKLTVSLKETERQMAMDMAETGRVRGGGEKTVLEDDLDA